MDSALNGNILVKTRATGSNNAVGIISDCITVADVIQRMRTTQPLDATETRALAEISRELAAQEYDVFTVTPGGGLLKVSRSTYLKEIVFTSRVKTDNGIVEVPAVELEIGAYAKVGCCS